MLKKLIIIALLFQISLAFNLSGQERSLEGSKPIYLIDCPTANILTEDRGYGREPAKYFNLKLRVYGEGGMIGGISVGITKLLMFGVTYGGQNVIGLGDVKWNPSPGINVRLRLYPEKYPFPTIAFGFDSQGYGAYYEDLERYAIKSKGLYLVFSKNYGNPLLNLGFHGGINYSTENKGGDKDLNIFLGVQFVLEDEIAFVWEYDLATNDNNEKSLGAGKGYMNAAVRWLFAKKLVLEFSIKNLLKNQKNLDGEVIPNSNRELKIIYSQNL